MFSWGPETTCQAPAFGYTGHLLMDPHGTVCNTPTTVRLPARLHPYKQTIYWSGNLEHEAIPPGDCADVALPMAVKYVWHIYIHSVPLAIKVLCHQPLYRVIFAVFLAVLAFETHAYSTVLRVAQA